MATEEQKNPTDEGKEFGLSSVSVDNKITVYVLTVLIFLAGLLAYQSMPSESFPEIVTPEIYIGTAYPGNSPLDMEKLITRPLEKEINGITGIDEIISTSVQGYSTIQVKFDFSVTPEEALRKVKDKVDIAKSDPDFPTDLPADPNVFEMNFAELVPILNLNLSGEFSSDQLKEYAEYLEDEIEALPEISKVEIRGIDDKEVEVAINRPKMESLEISFSDIANAIRGENVSISGGDLLVDGFRRNVRVVGEFDDPNEIGNVIVKSENGNIVYLRDIAEVSFGEIEKESYAREYRQPVVMLDVMKRGGENLIEASTKIDTILAHARQEYLPANLVISKTNDQTDATKTQLGELENNIIFGVLLVTLVLMFFLGLRNALFVGIAIPLSMLMSFLLLNIMGVTLNTIVLFSLVLALGMLVDNGIVVVENIYRFRSEGYSAIQAAKQGVGEVAVPIIASTATTLAAFVPLAFWPGIFGEFMKYLPITLIIVLSSSLFVGLVINPVLAASFLKVKEDPVNKPRMRNIALIFAAVGVLMHLFKLTSLGNLLLIIAISIPLFVYVLNPASERFQERFLPRLENAYRDLLQYALKGRRAFAFFFGTFGLLILSVVLIAVFPPKVIFFPVNQPAMVNVYIELPIGTDIEETNSLTQELEDQVLNIIKKYEVTEKNAAGRDTTYNYMVESVIAQVGAGTTDPNEGPSNENTPHKAKITVAMVEFQNRRGVPSSQVLDEIRAGLRAYPGVQITVDKNKDGPPAGAPISIQLTGEDYDQLMAEANNMRNFLNERDVPGVEQLKLNVELGKPETMINVDRDKARRLGVSTGQIGEEMRTALYGLEVSTYKEGEDDYPINIRLMDTYRYDPDALLNQRITFRDPGTGRIKQVPISAVAQSQRTSTFSAVKRNDLDRSITITSNVLSAYNPTEVVNQIRKELQNYEVPKGISVSYTGEQEQQAEELGFLSGALAVAGFLIFLIMVAQFNSAIKPFIIMIAVLLSLIGVFLGLVIFRQDFVIMMTMIGLISLAGVVVNNAIVLVDYSNLLINRRKKELGLDAEARLPLDEVYNCLVVAGSTRLRPVLLTAITTVLGLIPLAIGLNVDFFNFMREFDANIYVGGDNVIFWGPMAWTIVYGLTFATFLTLIIVPVMFLLTTRLQYAVAGWFGEKPAEIPAGVRAQPGV